MGRQDQVVLGLATLESGLQFSTKSFGTPKEILPILRENLDYTPPPHPLKQCCVTGKLIVDGKINIVQGCGSFSTEFSLAITEM